MPFFSGMYKQGESTISVLKEYTIYMEGQNTTWRDKRYKHGKENKSSQSKQKKSTID